LSIPETLDLDVLRNLSSKVGIGRLDGLEDASYFTGNRVVLSNGKLSLSCKRLDALHVFLSKSILVSSTTSRDSNSGVISSSSTTALRVKEGGSPVRWDSEFATERRDIPLCIKLLNSEEERNTSSSRKLNGGRSVVNSIFLLELNCSTAANLISQQHIRLCNNQSVYIIYQMYSLHIAI